MQIEWIPVDERFPEVDKDGFSDYILISYSNYSLIDIGHYEEKNGEGAFYPGDKDRTCSSYDLIVNAWMPIIPAYKEE